VKLHGPRLVLVQSSNWSTALPARLSAAFPFESVCRSGWLAGGYVGCEEVTRCGEGVGLLRSVSDSKRVLQGACGRGGWSGMHSLFLRRGGGGRPKSRVDRIG
jgi:hypothetical protein